MKIKPYICVFFMLLFITCSCTTKKIPPKAWATKDVELTLPPPSSEKPIQIQQLLTTTHQGKTHSLIVLLDIQKNELNLVGLTPVGIRLFTIQYQQQGIYSKTSLPIANLPKANQVLLDIMLAYWPKTAWLENLPENWSLEDVENKRYLRNSNHEIVTEIIYTGEKTNRTPVNIIHHMFGYTINLENMEEPKK